MLKRRFIVSMISLSLISGCSNGPTLGGAPGLSVSSAGELPPPLAKDLVRRSDLFTVGPYDKLSIEVYGVEDLAVKNILVDANGYISFPLVGSVAVSGLTPSQIETAIALKLRQSYVRDPKVTVNILESVSNFVTIDGQVRRPGQYPVAGGMTLLRSLSLAEGANENARLNDVVVFRTVAGQRYAALYNLAAIRRGRYPDPEIFANDVVMVGDDTSRRLFRDLIVGLPAILTPIVILLTQS